MMATDIADLFEKEIDDPKEGKVWRQRFTLFLREDPRYRKYFEIFAKTKLDLSDERVRSEIYNTGCRLIHMRQEQS